jgi:tripartite-type tricarboxylate transporter receptor subunit TctC
MRSLLLALLLVAGAATARVTAQAAERYPSRTIKLVVAFAPGGVADIMGRMIGQALQQKLGQTVIVENKPAATA